MTWLEALLLGILQGVSEFLPISSSGHLELGKVLLNIKNADNVLFTVAVHFATVLSTLVVYRKDILDLVKGSLNFEWNESTHFIACVSISMIPIGIIGVAYKDKLDMLFNGNVFFVGLMLIITSGLLFLTHILPQGQKPIGYVSAFMIGVAQTIAILPGLSRSGLTISTALLLKVERGQAARFSFLIVIVPILGASLLKLKDVIQNPELNTVGITPLVIGTLTSFIVGLFACRTMISLVRKGSLIGFAIYCLIVGLLAISSSYF